VRVVIELLHATWPQVPAEAAAVERPESVEAACRPEQKSESATERTGAQREAPAMTMQQAPIQRLEWAPKELQQTAMKYEASASSAEAMLRAEASPVAEASSPAAGSSAESWASAESSGAGASSPAAT
jgi:hypothetical protein